MDDLRKENSGQAATSLCACITQYFHQQVPEEQGIRVHFEADAPQTSQALAGHDCRCALSFALPDGTYVEGELRVENVGGNMYAVEARLSDDRPRTFSICLVTASIAACDTSARQVGAFLLDGIKRLIGERWLREASLEFEEKRDASRQTYLAH